MLTDFHRHARHFHLLAKEVAARVIPLVIATDSQCHESRKLTADVMMLPLDPERTWRDFGAVTSLL